MREIRYRAKRINGNQWVYGQIVSNIDIKLPQNTYRLGKFFELLELGVFDINTLGQYISLKDKNGKEIYEGECLGGILEYGYISYCNKCKSFQYFCDYNEGCQACTGDLHWYELVESIKQGTTWSVGNIYNNPELLEI